MKRSYCVIVLLACTLQLVHAQEFVKEGTVLPQHPRLLLLKGEEKQIGDMVATDATWRSMHQSILAQCDSFLSKPPVEHIKIGKRLLDKSRECLRRVFFLSYAWRMTQDQRYADRAEKEMLAVSAFSDWNPTHFLDVAEMTLAVSIGYDWLFDRLSDGSRAIIRNAILEKGLKASLDGRYNGWLTASHNWNQVCNGGMTYGALAIYEDEPTLCRQLINRAISTVALPMKAYGPDGGYPEGYSYWGYGTSYNVMMLSALEKALGSDYGLAEKNGFLKTASFLENMAGPSHSPFNFFDAGNGEELHPAMFWFASRLHDPSLLWMEKQRLVASESKQYLGNTLLPAIMIWGRGTNISNISPPSSTGWIGRGENPVALLRSSWSDTATFIGFKGGSPSINHAHMDIGSFVMDAEGVRWAMDFGMQSYESLESKGVDLWNMKQQSQRWEIFRYNNFAHNTLTVNNGLQRVEGRADFIAANASGPRMFAAIDMSSVYKGQLVSARRGVSLVNRSSVVVRDELETDSASTIRWTMATAATPVIIDAHTIELTKNGKKLQLQVAAPAEITLKTWPTTPVHSYDAPNPGTVLTGFEFTAPEHSKIAIEVWLVPAKALHYSRPVNIPLSQWEKR
jgi:hypothetical protein